METKRGQVHDRGISRRGMAARASMMVLLSLVLIPLLSLAVSAQASPIPAVDIECLDMNPEMNVHPEQLQPAYMYCIIHNDSFHKEEIKLESEIDDSAFAISMSPSGPYDIEGGGEIDVMVTFTGSGRMDAKTVDFDLMATVMSVTIGGDPITIPWEALGATSNKSGTITSLVYHKPVLDMNNKGSRSLEPNQESILTFSILNDGNSDDQLEVGISEGSVTALEAAGFGFVGDSFSRFNLVKGGLVNSNITIIAPDAVTEEKTVEIVLEAKSMLASDLEHVQSITLSVTVVKSPTVVGGISIDGLSSLSDEDIQMYSALGGGIFVLLLLVIIISKATKKSNKTEDKVYDEPQALDVVKDVPVNNDLDFDDLDFDDLDDLDDLDDFDFDDL